MSDIQPNPEENNVLVQNSIKSIKEEGISPQELLDRLTHLQEEYFNKNKIALSIIGSDGKTPMTFESILQKVNDNIKFVENFTVGEGKDVDLNALTNFSQLWLQGVKRTVTRVAGLRDALKETFINKYKQFDNPEVYKRFKVLWKMLYNEDIE